MDKQRFNIDILIKNHKKKNQTKKDVFKVVLDKCINHTIFMSKKNLKSCYYTIPVFIYGLPLYNQAECQKYLEKKLKKLKFEIQSESNKIFISWKHLV